MTDQSVRDDVIEAVLRSRAGDGAPSDLHAQILAAVAVDGPRPAAPRSIRHPWRLLAVAAVLLGTVGTAVFVGGSRVSEVTPTPGPSLLAVTNPSPAATPSPTIEFVEITPVPEPPTPSCDQIDAFIAATHAVVGTRWGSSTPAPVGAPVKAGSIAAWADSGDAPSQVVLVKPASGRQTTLLSLGITIGKYSDLEWAPDGSALAVGFGSDECGDGVLVWTKDGVVLLQKDAARSFDGEEGSIAWSPDSTRLVTRPMGAMNDSGGEHHWIVPRDGGAVTDLAPPCAHCNSFDFTWSPNGRWLAGQYEQFDVLGPGSVIVGNEIGIGVVTFDTETSKWTVIPETSGEAMLGWSNDHTVVGQQYIGDNQGRLITYDAIDGSRKVLPYNAPDAFRMLPNGDMVVTISVSGAGASQRDSIGTQDISTGKTRTVWTAPKGVAIGGGVLAPDGSAIAMTGGTGDQPTDTWVVRLDGSGATKFPGAIVGRTGWQPILR
jgi:Tol biopolymer transport system component